MVDQCLLASIEARYNRRKNMDSAAKERKIRAASFVPLSPPICKALGPLWQLASV